MPVQRINPDSVHKNPAYSQAVVLPANARTVLVGGQNGVDRDGNIVGVGDIGAQAAQAIGNLVACLEAAGASVEDLVQVRIHIVSGQDLRPAFGAWMAVWGARTEPPTVTGVFVPALARPDLLIEIEAMAVLAD